VEETCSEQKYGEFENKNVALAATIPKLNLSHRCTDPYSVKSISPSQDQSVFPKISLKRKFQHLEGVP